MFMLQLTQPNLPTLLIQKIEAVKEEEDAYAADELVELGEEILSQLAAMGIAAYLKQPKQKEVFNDFLISLFLSDGHSYNAGPLYRWAANMLKEAEGEEAALLRSFFWQTTDGKEVLNEQVHHLASLRNAVMHGFFVLPPERNREEAQKIEAILKKISEAKLFEHSWGDFHFLGTTHFNGHWNLRGQEDWTKFTGCYSFGKLAARVSHEYDHSFREEENIFARKDYSTDEELQKEVSNFLTISGKGALICWTRPGDSRGENAYRNLLQTAEKLNYAPVFYVLHERGANFTSTFLLRELGKMLQELTGDEKALKDPLKFVKDPKTMLSKKPVVILHDIHLALFSPNHLTNLFNALYDAGIPVLATGYFYHYLAKFFNRSVDLRGTTVAPDLKELETSLKNYLRFKGPSHEQEDEQTDFEKLKTIVLKLNESIMKEMRVVARRFADAHNYPIEYVHEAFAILSPFYDQDKEEFIKDEVDELYGFPKTIEESSHVFLTLGRRDVKLEYQHKVLTS
jgi:hypothetical protein